MSLHRGDFTPEQVAGVEALARRLRIPFSAAVRVLIDHALSGAGWLTPSPHPTLEIQRAERSVPGFVYLFQELEGEGLYKIGFSTNPLRRLEQVARSLMVAVELVCSIPTHDMRTLEAELHERFTAVRRRGEWFALGEGDVEFITRMAGAES